MRLGICREEIDVQTYSGEVHVTWGDHMMRVLDFGTPSQTLCERVKGIKATHNDCVVVVGRRRKTEDLITFL